MTKHLQALLIGSDLWGEGGGRKIRKTLFCITSQAKETLNKSIALQPMQYCISNSEFEPAVGTKAFICLNREQLLLRSKWNRMQEFAIIILPSDDKYI